MGRVNYGAKAFNSPPREGESELERGDGRRARKMKRKEGGEYTGGLRSNTGLWIFLFYSISQILYLYYYMYTVLFC